MNPDTREQGLLQLVADYRDQECRRLLGEARGRAADLLRQAYARERAALHQRVIAERERARGLIQAARAEQATRARRRSEQIDAQIIDAAWPRLHGMLLARWAAPATRAGWIATALAQALARLPRGDWTIHHPPAWPDAERAALAAELIARGGVEPLLQADPGISAGLLFAADGAVLDMGIEGLLADRAQVEARLLALWKQGQSDPAAAATATPNPGEQPPEEQP